MLAVARRTAPAIRWEQGPAEALPYPDGAFDAVVSQFGLMFFADRAAALREMFRVLRSSRQLAVAVWASLDESPGYAALVRLLQRLFGSGAADALRAPFALGDRDDLAATFAGVGLPAPSITTTSGPARFPSIAAWITTDVKGWSPLGGQLSDAQFRNLLAEAETALQEFATDGAIVEFPIAAHIAVVVKP